MRLSQILDLNNLDNDINIKNIYNDSRNVEPESLFFAYPGFAFDGRNYIEDAIKKGAAAIAYDPENFKPDIKSDVIFVPINELAQKISTFANNFYAMPDKKLNIYAVTGTNGKTTTAYLLTQAYQLLGEDSAYIGTLGHGRYRELENLTNTTPDAILLNKLFNQYVMQNTQHVCMEVSSHALSQARVNNINFKHAIYTNLSHDHLDYHNNMQEYALAKAKLFAFESLQSVLINKDDAHHELMTVNVNQNCKKFYYSLHKDADFYPLHIDANLNGTDLVVQSPLGQHKFSLKLLGEFNIYNAIAVFATLVINNVAPEKAGKIMSQLQPVPGRMEVIKQEPFVIIDYAHTPDALKNAIVNLNKLSKGRIIVVFGCGGNRDKYKRPLMGKVAAEFADVTIVTSDNPRDEDPEHIIQEIIADNPITSNFFAISNREVAIRKALNMMNAKDILLIAGKGHESYQEINKQKIAYSDKKIVENHIEG